MRNKMIGVSMAVLMLSACGPKQLALPSDPIDKAATCAVVSAAKARADAPEHKGDLGFDAQTRIIHYAMLAGVEAKDFSTKTASAVVGRMSELEADVTAGKWQTLVQPCDQAFPEVKRTAGLELPKRLFDAQLGCYSMGDFLVKAVTTHDPGSQQHLTDLMKMKRDLDGAIGIGLKARGASDIERTRVLKHEALASMTRTGAPAELMKMCTARFA